MVKRKQLDNRFVYPQNVLGYNAHIHFINSGRGLRKTHNYLKWACERYVYHGEQLGYTRRSKTEIDENAFIMFTGLERYGDFPAGSFRVVGDTIIFNRKAFEAGESFKPDDTYTADTEDAPTDKKLKNKIKTTDRIKDGDEIAGFLFSISTAHNKKSSAYPNIVNMIFDEYLQENGKYLRDEPSKFFSLCETVFRDREKVRIFLLGNTVSTVNPYYIEMGLRPNAEGEYTYFKKKGAVIQNAVRDEFKAHKLTTPIGKILDNTAYGRHVLDNVSITDNTANCGMPPYSERALKTNIIVFGKKYGVWGLFNFKAGTPPQLYVCRQTVENMLWITVDKEIYPVPNLAALTLAEFKAKFKSFAKTNRIWFEDLAMKQELIEFFL